MSQQIIEALGAIVREHGARAVLETLRDAADTCTDGAETNGGRRWWGEVSSGISLVMLRVQYAEAQGPTFGMGLEVLADVAYVAPDDAVYEGKDADESNMWRTTLAELRAANGEDSDLVAACSSWQVGDEMVFGGGASPAVHVRRVS